jgi:hypothetical protein
MGRNVPTQQRRNHIFGAPQQQRGMNGGNVRSIPRN